MTRINVGVSVLNLTDEHLLAEHREIKRICSNYAKRLSMPNGLKGLPTKMTLGTGHVLFFVNKGGYTLARYKAIHAECLQRGFDVTDYSNLWSIYGDNLQSYEPTYADKVLLTERIIERLRLSPKPYWHYYGDVISTKIAIEMLEI